MSDYDITPSVKVYKVTIEGQTLELPGEIAGDDARLKAALQPYWPGAANAKFVRAEAEGVVTVNVIKQAGTKGALTKGGDAMAHLVRCKESRNPVIALSQELQGLDPRKLPAEELIKLDRRVKRALERGEKERESIDLTLRRLSASRAVPSHTTPTGF